MSLAFLESVDVEDITARAKQVSFAQTLLRLFAFTLFAAGWLAAKFFAVLWLAAVWVAVALAEGWNAGHADIRRARARRAAAAPGG